jgi:hypothetical protein
MSKNTRQHSPLVGGFAYLFSQVSTKSGLVDHEKCDPDHTVFHAYMSVSEMIHFSGALRNLVSASQRCYDLAMPDNVTAERYIAPMQVLLTPSARDLFQTEAARRHLPPAVLLRVIVMDWLAGLEVKP